MGQVLSGFYCIQTADNVMKGIVLNTVAIFVFISPR
jgi:hypothetical protein